MTATYRRRNRLLARLGVCVVGGLVAGGLLAIPFSGHESSTPIAAAPGASAPTASAGTSTAGTSTNGTSTAGSGTATALTDPASTTVTPTTVAATVGASTGTSGTGATTDVATTAAPDTSLPVVADPVPAVDARAYVVIDADTGATLASSEADTELPVGSIVKLLTAYVVMQAGDPAKVVTVPELQLIDGESQIYLRSGEQFSRDLLLRAMLIVSAGDAAETLAVDVAGSQDAFVEQMNAAARALGLTHTVAANPEGLDAEGAHSSASDVAVLARTLMSDPTFQATVARRSASLHGATFPATNTLLGTYPGATGVKTGHTTAAGYCLAAAATRDGRSLIVVVLGTSSIPARDLAAAALLNWGFDHLSGATTAAAA